ncbi:hypothetical protein M2139_002602 [Enterococcus sp. PF1-24]|nr:hypothetical protein [Enterococcus sp. PFB1-1]MDH6402697.1 hypothetical protein [Enterococcus sp. PF1-24]
MAGWEQISQPAISYSIVRNNSLRGEKYADKTVRTIY